jgi:hypothetical protein
MRGGPVSGDVYVRQSWGIEDDAGSLRSEYRDLVATLIEQAVKDMRRPKPQLRENIAEWQAARDSAAKFFFGEDSNFEFFAEAIGLDPEAIRERLER